MNFIGLTLTPKLREQLTVISLHRRDLAALEEEFRAGVLQLLGDMDDEERAMFGILLDAAVDAALETEELTDYPDE